MLLQMRPSFLILLHSQRVNPKPLFINDIPLPLLPQMFPQATVFSSTSILQREHRIVRFLIQICFLLPVSRRGQVKVSDKVWVQRNHLWLQLVEECLDLCFLSLFGILERIDFERVEVWLASTWYDDAGKATVV